MTTTITSSFDSYTPAAERYTSTGETTPDKDGMVRPVFRVGDIPIAFYSQDDEPLINGAPEADITPVIASPLGLAEAAMHLSEGSSDTRATRLYESIRTEDYNDDVLLFLDQIDAAVSYDDDLDRRQGEVQEEGFALMLAALEGDEAAQSIVDARLQRSREDHDAAHLEMNYGATPAERDEALTYLEGLAIVHSTKREVQRNEHGDVVLSTTGDHRRRDVEIPNRYPRATLHFTINGEVTGHLNGWSWDQSSTLIVANLAKTVAAGRLPYALNTPDTSFDLNPGEQLTLPDAIVIHPRSDMQPLYEQLGNDISYKYVDHYSQHDRQAFAEKLQVSTVVVEALTDEQIATRLRQYALEQAVFQNGVTTGVVGIESNASSSGKLDTRVRGVGRVLGAEISLHTHQPNSRVEERITQQTEYLGKPVRRYTYTLPPSASYAARRMYVANGYLAPGSRIPADELRAIHDRFGDGI